MMRIDERTCSAPLPDAVPRSEQRQHKGNNRLYTFSATPITPVHLLKDRLPLSSLAACAYSTKSPSPGDELTHVSPSGTAHMVPISSKQTTRRIAIAQGRVLFSNSSPAQLIAQNALKKGDVLAVARIAGI